MSGAFELSETVSYEETLTFQGKTCRIGTGWQLLPASGNYMTMHFHTPVSGTCYYAFATVQKTGDELEVTLVEGGTYTGGSEILPWKLNRKYRNEPCLFTNLKYGLSNLGATISGGISAPPNGLGGESQGASKPGGTQEGGKFIILENDMDYTLKITAIGGNTKVLALTTLAHT